MRFPPRERNDLCDGQLIGEETVLEATKVLRAFVGHCRFARVDLDAYDRFSFESLPAFAKTCLILEILGQRHCLPMFMASDYHDDAYPLSETAIAEALGDEPASASVFDSWWNNLDFQSASGTRESTSISTSMKCFLSHQFAIWAMVLKVL